MDFKVVWDPQSFSTARSGPPLTLVYRCVKNKLRTQTVYIGILAILQQRARRSGNVAFSVRNAIMHACVVLVLYS